MVFQRNCRAEEAQPIHPPSFTIKMEAVHSSETPQHIPTKQHRNPNDKYQLFSCFHIFTSVQAQCVHNNAASCSTVTATNAPTFKLCSPTHSSQSKMLFTHWTLLAHILTTSCHFSLCTVQTSLPLLNTHQECLKHISHSLCPKLLHLLHIMGNVNEIFLMCAVVKW